MPDLYTSYCIAVLDQNTGNILGYAHYDFSAGWENFRYKIWYPNVDKRYPPHTGYRIAKTEKAFEYMQQAVNFINEDFSSKGLNLKAEIRENPNE